MVGAVPWDVPVTVRVRDEAAEPSDELLMARVARKDSGALEVLYNRYGAAALGLAARILGDRNSGEEIVQEAFWRVWNRGKTYKYGRGHFAAWLFGIVRNLSIDELRRRNGRPTVWSTDLADATIFEIPDADVDVAASALSKLTGEQVRAAIGRLPESQRHVLELAYFDGLTHQEISRRLGEPLGTVHTRARLALLKLREQLTALQPGGAG